MRWPAAGLSAAALTYVRVGPCADAAATPRDPLDCLCDLRRLAILCEPTEIRIAILWHLSLAQSGGRSPPSRSEPCGIGFEDVLAPRLFPAIIAATQGDRMAFSFVIGVTRGVEEPPIHARSIETLFSLCMLPEIKTHAHG
jgi:hypothetical protein